MLSPAAEQALIDAQKTGKAVFKFISPNDVGLTRSHQYGYLLPKSAWKLFTTIPPEKVKGSTNPKQDVRVLWHDGRVTNSVVTWYGRESRSEYRLTRFGKEFPFRTPDDVGALLVIIPESYQFFRAYVLSSDDDIEGIQSELGVEILETSGFYLEGAKKVLETEDECVNRHFRDLVKTLSDFPKSAVLSQATRQAVENCIRNYLSKPLDVQLMMNIELEFQLFRMLERKVCQNEITRLFKDVDDFIKTAGSIMNRRKSRAGHSLENHFAALLKRESIPFESHPDIEGEPDIVIPSARAYDDPSHPENQVIALGLKTTCKDRWRQVLQEAPRIKRKHLLTLQAGISPAQLSQMRKANLCLIVPESLHSQYYNKDSKVELLTVEQFIGNTRKMLRL